MYEAYEYTAQNGIMVRKEYQEDYRGHATGTCHRTDLYHWKNVGFEEKDGMTNDEMKEVIAQ